MQPSFQWRCATCGHQADVKPGFCPTCSARPGPSTVAERWNRDHPGDPMLAAASGRDRLGPSATSSRSRRGTGRASNRARSPIAIGSLMAGILLGSTLWAIGAFDSGPKTSRPSSAATRSRSVSRPRSTAPTKPRLKPAAANAPLGAHRIFAGRAFSIAYPRGWTIKAAEAPTPWGTDTTITAPGDPHTMLRVDVTTSPASTDPITAAEPVIAGVARQPGYRPLGLTNATFAGRPAARWEFLVTEAGLPLHKEDVFFTARSGIDIALLTSAPADAYGKLAKRFAAIRRSLIAP